MSSADNARGAGQDGTGPRERRRRQRHGSKSLWRRIPYPVYIVAFALLGSAIAIPIFLSQRGGDAPPAQNAQTQTQSVSLGVAKVGQTAPGFSLKDQNGQTYTLNPGDGRPHVLAFYMGNF